MRIEAKIWNREKNRRECSRSFLADRQQDVIWLDSRKQNYLGKISFLSFIPACETLEVGGLCIYRE